MKKSELKAIIMECIEEGFWDDAKNYVKDKRAFKDRSAEYNLKKRNLTSRHRLRADGTRSKPLKSGEKRNLAVDAEMKDLHTKLFTDPNRNKKKG
jgi:hypothetical protein